MNNLNFETIVNVWRLENFNSEIVYPQYCIPLWVDLTLGLTADQYEIMVSPSDSAANNNNLVKTSAESGVT